MENPPPQDKISVVGEEVFKEIKLIVPCSYVVGICGHQWKLIHNSNVAFVKCNACECGVLAVKMENCPFCNEPASQMVVRSDYVPRGQGVPKRCQGEIPQGDSLDLVIEKSHWVKAQEGDKTFESKQKESNTKK